MTIYTNNLGQQSVGQQGQAFNPGTLAIKARRAPTSSDYKFPYGQQWINLNNSYIYILTSVASGVANWKLISSLSTAGTTAAMAGTPGTIVVSDPTVLSTSLIVFSRKTAGGTLGNVSISAQSAGSFTLLSTGNETSAFNYVVINQ